MTPRADNIMAAILTHLSDRELGAKRVRSHEDREMLLWELGQLERRREALGADASPDADIENLESWLGWA